jgi:hypothetical protein
VDADPRGARLAKALCDARLLVTGRGADNQPTIEVAHEGLLSGWPAFARWIGQRRDALRLVTQIENAARQWHEKDRLERYAWDDERVMEAVAVIRELGPDLTLSATARAFLGPIEREAMIALLDRPETDHALRARIGVRLALLGDGRPGVGLGLEGLPDIDWKAIPGGEVMLKLDDGSTRGFAVEPFEMARYPVTWGQFRAFIDADDGYGGGQWWPVRGPFVEPGGKRNRWDNHPVVEVAWYEALAFCR